MNIEILLEGTDLMNYGKSILSKFLGVFPLCAWVTENMSEMQSVTILKFSQFKVMKRLQ